MPQHVQMDRKLRTQKPMEVVHRESHVGKVLMLYRCEHRLGAVGLEYGQRPNMEDVCDEI